MDYLPHSYERLVNFANFCQRHSLEPVAVARLMYFAKRACNEGTRECNGEATTSTQRDLFEKTATEYGFGTEWNGLFPTLTKDGQDHYLPR